MQSYRPSAAFTVIELMVALALAAILAGGALLAWRRLEAALHLEAGLHQIAADLRDARTVALASASGARLVFAAGSATYREEREDADGSYRVERVRWLPRGVVVAEVNSGGDLTFSGRGWGENATVVLIDGRGVRRALRLNQRGRVTIGTAGA